MSSKTKQSSTPLPTIESKLTTFSNKRKANPQDIFSIENTKTPVMDLKELEDAILKENDPSIREHDHAIQFWSNGEITSTKGGVLFGERSEFIVGIAVLDFPILKLPYKQSENESYAFITKGQALKFRSHLKQLLFPTRKDVDPHWHILASSLQEVYDGRSKYKEPKEEEEESQTQSNDGV